MLRMVTSATVTTKVTSAPRVNRLLNAMTNDACSTRSIASPARTAMKAPGVASMSRVKGGARSPNAMASRPHTMPAV